MKGPYGKREPIHIGEAIKHALTQYSGHKNPALARIRSCWKDVVGETISNNTRPVAFKNASLLVLVSGSTWLHHLQFLKVEIMNKLNYSIFHWRAMACLKVIHLMDPDIPRHALESFLLWYVWALGQGSSGALGALKGQGKPASSGVERPDIGIPQIGELWACRKTVEIR